MNFSTSLHYTVKGIDTAFKQTFSKDFGIDTPDYCFNCHIEDCSTCHPVHKKTIEMSECVDCHERIGANYIGKLANEQKAKHPDIHYEKGLECLDCHSLDKIHGDGNLYTFAEEAIEISCEDCHYSGVEVKGKKAKLYDSSLLAHRLHEDIACSACHADYYQTCYNCHFETGEFESYTTYEFHLLRYNDRLYPAYVQTMSFKDKTSKAAGIISPHTITSNARKCEECHDNQEEVFLINFDGRLFGYGVELAKPPSKLEVDLSNFGMDFKLDIMQLGTLIILGVIGGIGVHLIKRRITLGRWIG
jgi:hypothetical protein